MTIPIIRKKSVISMAMSRLFAGAPAAFVAFHAAFLMVQFAFAHGAYAL
jgi:hypothetical protein